LIEAEAALPLNPGRVRVKLDKTTFPYKLRRFHAVRAICMSGSMSVAPCKRVEVCRLR
jgi:hypothetical protein